jgi:hypothetical protein
MTARLLAACAQALLALLLIVGVPTGEQARADAGRVVRQIEFGLQGQNTHREPLSPTDPTELWASPELPENGDGPETLPASALATPFVLDLARLVRIARVSYATAPPSHRPCAAPPTGPPFV